MDSVTCTVPSCVTSERPRSSVGCWAPEHPYTLCANHNLAVDLALLGQDARAMKEAGSVLARSRATRGAAHPDTLACEINASRVGRSGREEILTAIERALGPAHPLVVSARSGAWIECDIEPPPT